MTAAPFLASEDNPLAHLAKLGIDIRPTSYEGSYKGFTLTLTKEPGTFSYWMCVAKDKRNVDVEAAGFDGGPYRALSIVVDMIDRRLEGSS